MKTLYFDESGQTGTNLLDREQAYFSVASTDVNEADARALLREYFPKYVNTDIKFRKLFRHRSNYQALIEFARTVSRQPERFFCYLVNKKFAILAKMVDWLIEPLFSELGYDWYKDDYGRRWVNMFYYAFEQTDNDSLLNEVTSLYGLFSDSPTSNTLAAMQNRYSEIAKSGPEILRPFMNFAAVGANVFEQNYSLATFNDSNDVHITCVVVSVGWWRARHDEDFEVIHDQSTHFFRRQNIWDRVTDMSVSEGIVRVGAKSLQFPLRVSSTRPGDSALLASLQICDLVSGFVVKTRSATLSAEERRVLDEMMSAGMGEIGFDCIDAGYDFIDGPPAIAEGPDAVDEIITLTYRNNHF